ncbi:MAG: hypothetical protein GQE15_33465 [Archangiaceae bacterium]|nr:hypothetical protein [Archangiaceae bacterium]
MKLIALVGLLAGTAEAMSCSADRVELLPARGVVPTRPVLLLTLSGIAAEQPPTGLVFRSGTKAIAATVEPVQGALRQRVRRFFVRQYFVRAAAPLEPGEWTLEATELVSGPFTTATQARYTVRNRPMPAVFVGPVRFLGFGTDDPNDHFARVAAVAPSAAAVFAELKLEGLHYSRTVVVGVEDGEARFGDFVCWSLPHLPNGRHLTVTITPVALDGLRGDPTSFEVDVPGVNEPTEEELEALDAGTPKKFVPAHLNER